MRVSVSVFSDSWRCSITAEMRSWPSAKMSASIVHDVADHALGGKAAVVHRGRYAFDDDAATPIELHSGTRLRCESRAPSSVYSNLRTNGRAAMPRMLPAGRRRRMARR